MDKRQKTIEDINKLLYDFDSCTLVAINNVLRRLAKRTDSRLNRLYRIVGVFHG